MDLKDSPHLLEYAKHQPIVKAKSFSRTLKKNSKREAFRDIHEKGIHFGQRKLLLSEVEFITNEYDKLDKENKLIIYVGASGGIGSTHSYFLVKMFPMFEYHLYDRNDFYPPLYNLKNVKIFKRWFLDSDISTYKNKNVLLISDLRDPEIGVNKEIHKMNKIILEDIGFQQRMYEQMKPKSALFKFRLPFLGKKKVTTLDGDIYFQAFHPKTSAETRIIPNGKLKTYDIDSYNEKLFYFNMHTRRQYYEHNHKCYCHCYDCTSEIVILDNYLKKFKKTGDACELGRKISEHLKRPIYANTTLEWTGI